MLSRLSFIVSLLALIAAGVTGCGSAATPTTATADTSRLQTPTFSSDTGALMVRILMSQNSQPVKQQTFYAAPLIPIHITPSANGLDTAYVASLDVTTAARGNSDDTGTVIISNLAPGKYGLALYIAPRGPVLLQQASDGADIVFDIVAGRVTDLGDMLVLLEASLLEP